MNNSLVFVRTAAGEAAVQQPTRLVQRNLRLALTLVDGRREVANIAARFGDCAVAEAALAELHRSGLIRAMGQAAADGAGGDATPASRVPDEVLAPKVPGLPAQVTEVMPRIACPSVTQAEAGQGGQGATGTPCSHSATRGQRVPSEEGRKPTADRRHDMPASSSRRRHVACSDPSDTDTGAAGEHRTGWARRAVALVAAAAMLIVTGITFYPYGRHLTELEQRLGGAIGQPVHIRDAHFSWLPSPNVVLEGVTIGSLDPIVIGSVRLAPDPLYLLDGRPAVRSLEFERSEIAARRLPVIANWFSRAAADGVRVRKIEFAEIALHFGDVTTVAIHGEGEMDHNGALTTLRFAAGEALNGELTSVASGYRIKVSSVAGWAPAFVAPLAFDHFEAEGSLASDAVRLDKVYARLADGAVSGVATILINDPRQFSAELEVKHVELRKLLAQTKSDLMLQGSASGILKVDGGNASPAAAGNYGVALEGTITVQHGVLDGFDLVEAARSEHRAVRGGATRFEAVTGQLRADARAWQVSRLHLQSGLMSANGEIAVSGEQRLAGSVTVELRGSAGSRRVPVSLSGSVKEPVLNGSRVAAVRGGAQPS